MSAIRDRIDLTDTEKGIFEALIQANKQADLGSTLRCAGGWVRDKLMGRQSLDIDIALDNMLGKDFAERVNEYLKAHGEETHHVAVIMSNPDQSKHLETARMKIRGVWIDLVNLRSETYTQHSRIPTMEFGTPEEDAERRDFTINSMFFNINTGDVEDFTRRGMADLRAGIIRTPLPPKETFLDDPLRVLRAVRFASRLGFELEEALVDAAADKEVRLALMQKVSRERVGTELEGMLHGADPVQAVRMLHQLQLFQAVFMLPPQVGSHLGGDFAASGTELLAAAHALVKAWESEEGLSQDEQRQCLLAAALLPLRQIKFKGGKGKPNSAATHIVRESLKGKVKDCEAVDALHKAAPGLLEVAQALHGAGGVGNEEGVSDMTRIALGRAIRQLKGLWKAGCILASLLPAPEARPLGVQDDPAAAECSLGSPHLAEPAGEGLEGAAPESDGPGCRALSSTHALGSRLEVCRALVAAAEAFGISDCWTWKPVLDGKQVMSLMGMEKGGPALGQIMERVVDWQLCHPQGAPEECRQYLLDSCGSGSSMQQG